MCLDGPTEIIERIDRTIELEGLSVPVTADEIRGRRDFAQLNRLARRPQPAAASERIYRLGWQSWSVAAWTAPAPFPVQMSKIRHPMQTDPLSVNDKREVDFEPYLSLPERAIGLERILAQVIGWAALTPTPFAVTLLQAFI